MGKTYGLHHYRRWKNDMSPIDISSRYTKVIRYLVIALAILSLYGIALSQQITKQVEEPGGLDVKNVGTISRIYINMQFHTSDNPVFIRYCADRFDGVKILCPLQGSEVEVRTSQGWRPAKQKLIHGVFTPPHHDYVFSTMIKPHDEATFQFEFSRNYFEVEPGQQLRVVIDTWNNEQSMKNDDEPIKIYSQPFKCPK